jgi:hypothetical protein
MAHRDEILADRLNVEPAIFKGKRSFSAVIFI